MRFTALYVALVTVLAAFGAQAAGPDASRDSYELRTWAIVSSAPTGDPLSFSSSFRMRSRLGGPFVGHSESTSFGLWGCSAYTPVEFAFYAVPCGADCVTLRWTVESLAGIHGFNLYRSSTEDGSFMLLNADVIPPESPGVYVDRSVWPGSSFWYQLRALSHDGSEQPIVGPPVMATTEGTIVTRLYPPSPNPFVGGTVIRYDIGSVTGPVTLDIVDVSGRIVKSLAGVRLSIGRSELTWDGTDESGRRVASGVYFCRLRAGAVSETQSMVLIR